MLYCFLLYKVNQPHVYKYHLLLGFPTHLGHLRALSRVLCAVQQVLISYLRELTFLTSSLSDGASAADL